MATFSYVYAADSSSGGTPAIDASTARGEVMIYNYGTDEVYINFNEAADDTCFYIPTNVGITFTGQKAKSDIYIVCAAGETANVGIIATPIS